MVISNLIGSYKSSSVSLQDNSLPWLPINAKGKNIDFTLDTPAKCLNLNTPSHSMLKKTSTNVGELKMKSTLDKQFKLKLSNIYSKKLSKFNLEKQLDTIHRRKHAKYTNNIVKKSLIRTHSFQSDSNSSYKYENITAQKTENTTKENQRRK